MKDWTIARRLTIGFGAVATVAAALGVFAFIRLVPIKSTALSIKLDAVPGVSTFGDITQNALTTEALSLEMALSEDATEMAAFERQIAAVADEANGLFTAYEKTIFSQEDRTLFNAVQAARDAMRTDRTRFLEFAKTHNARESKDEYDRALKGSLDEYIKASDAEEEWNQKSASEKAETITALAESARTGQAAGRERRDMSEAAVA